MSLHGQLFGHLAKRGVDMMQSEPGLPAMSMSIDRDDLMQSQQEHWNSLFTKLPVWGMVLVGFTVLFFYLVLVSLDYTIGRVVMTLAMIETPTVDYIPVSSLDNVDDTSKATTTLLIDGEAHVVEKNKPITSKIRNTLRHLTAHAGWSARWRGLGYCILYSICNGVVFGITSALFFWLPAHQVFAAIVAAVVTAPVHCAWTHKIISVAGPKGFFARMPSRNAWRQLWIPNVVASASFQLSFTAIVLLSLALIRGSISQGNDTEPAQFTDSFGIIIAKVTAVLIASFVLGFFVVLPTYAALTRIEATLLPDEDDTIVPFDRTFGGKVTPVVVGGSGFRYVKEVCRTFDSEARMRIMKLFFKGVAIALAVIVIYVHVLSFEFFFVIGPVAKQAAKEAGARMMLRL